MAKPVHFTSMVDFQTGANGVQRYTCGPKKVQRLAH